MALGLATGCGPDRKLLAADQSLLEAIAQAGLDRPSPLSRAQMPEINQVSASDTRPLDARPERPAEVNNLPPTARIRVTVNGQAILDQEIRAACYNKLRVYEGLPEKERLQKQAEAFNEAREQLIDRELIIQDMEHKLSANKQAEKALEKIREAGNKEFDRWERRIMEDQHMNNLDEFKEFLRQALGSTYEMARRQVVRGFMSNEYAKHNVFPPVSRVDHIAVQAYYDAHPEDFQVGEMVEWQDLFINASLHPSRTAARRWADVLADRVRSKEDFAKLADEFDNGIAKDRENASGIGMKRGEIRPPELETIVFQMKDGEVNVAELSTGYHIVRVIKHTQAGRMPFDEKVQKRIKDKLQGEIFHRELKHYVTELRRRAIIEKSDSSN